MSEFVCIKNQEQILKRLNELSVAKKGLICLYGKSGSGKSVILERFARQKNTLKITEIFKDKEQLKDFLSALKLEKSMLLFDEVGLYGEDLFELLRLYSDEALIILSSHKKLKIFTKEHFKSRILAEFELKNLEKKELFDYVKEKHGIELDQKELQFVFKICKHNLRNVDKLLKSFKELQAFLDKKRFYILRLSALENHLLG
ncbi:ATP-binding protein [Campylobacter vulpis]|uniref:Transformation system protein n=1 Tax=Campylobacter vulpis TaxID=1655500 RepID=A0ABS5P2E3_9BACT|nr:ATP-binding protein [Campylobacter vulpis]MBS4240849.1 transformation system protein [Campylobacter vulpis]MBS4252338.1 transformation system protein [Campylobacter vulpis]MBS4281621.1 transformation system protein [Campylobacter vulpis]MBS4313526.1 transformation system protein [Campylobacter vulpis]MBS4329647.1 transformation system protein [Campylobacter vulpis]